MNMEMALIQSGWTMLAVMEVKAAYRIAIIVHPGEATTVVIMRMLVLDVVGIYEIYLITFPVY